MPDQISPELFEHLVELAALELTAAEKEYLRKELNNQLKAIDELAAIPIPANTPIAAHGVPYTPENSPAMRADAWVPCEDVDAILGQVPEVDERYIIVPEIPHEELE